MADKLGPRRRKPQQAKGSQIFLSQNDYQISFDKHAFKQAIHAQGIKVTHHRAIPDPTGMQTRGDIHAVNAPNRSSDGYIYLEAGMANVFFSNNSNSVNLSQNAVMSNSTAYITLPETYDDKPEIPFLVAPWDRFYLADIEVRVVTSQFLESNSTGIDRAQFPITYVEHLIDANGIKYEEGTHFCLTEDGNIKWLTQNRPGWNQEIGRGTVYSIRYRYTPYFIVNRLIHEIRVSPITDRASMQRSVERMPYQVEVVRENVFHDTNKDPNAPKDDPRYEDVPSSGGNLGPNNG